MLEALPQVLTSLLAVVTFVAAVLAGLHAVLYKRDARAAVAWVALIWLVPLLGTVLYVAFGVNRIQRRAETLQRPRVEQSEADKRFRLAPAEVDAPSGREYLSSLVYLGDRVASHALVGGNRVELLEGGDAAYPAMLEEIAGARESITLVTYIFDTDRVGERFVAALGAAVRRGVEVRVLIDGVGVRYSRPHITTALAAEDIPYEVFLPPRVPWRFPYMNLRNHRKVLVVDGRVGFTGGMNLREGTMLSLAPSHPIQDVHLRVTGPVVAQLQSTFAQDWRFSAGEALHGPTWFPELTPTGTTLARTIPDGPDEDYDALRTMLLGALAVAQSSVKVVTPYFLPDTALVTALGVAALRGVTVDIVLPEHNNLALVQWASTAQLWQVLERDCRVWLTPPPFDHSKLMVVDGVWSLLGTANWDARSLRLNFEIDIECYDSALAQEVERMAEARIGRARPLTLLEVDSRPLVIRIRDGIARLFTPYL